MTQEPEIFRELFKKLVKVKHAADNQDELIANQGQALDGFSELANYRAIIEKVESEELNG